MPQEPQEQVVFALVGGELDYNEHVGSIFTRFEDAARCAYLDNYLDLLGLSKRLNRDKAQTAVNILKTNIDGVTESNLDDFAIDERLVDANPDLASPERRWELKSLKDFREGRWTSNSTDKVRVVPPETALSPEDIEEAERQLQSIKTMLARKHP